LSATTNLLYKSVAFAESHSKSSSTAFKMRIGCLQFAPQVGDVEHNLVRADRILDRMDPEEIENLDLLVLPEMAFSGESEAVCFIAA
jgi:hypothetical protein